MNAEVFPFSHKNPANVLIQVDVRELQGDLHLP